MYQKIIKTTFSAALDFLFPANEDTKKFEETMTGDLVKLLPASEHAAALFAYSDERVKHLVWEIKYYRNQKLTDIVGQLMAEKIRGEIQEKYFLVPIPLTARRLRERGYNHTELLAKAILKNLPKNFELASEFLKKIRHTPKQHSIENRADRFTNIVGAFEVPSSVAASVKNQNILIIDDVITTGATVAEAKRALLTAGAKSVEVFAIAH